MTARTAQELIRFNTGSRVWVEGREGAWYYTTDRDDNTAGRTWPTLAAMIRDLTDTLGFLRIPAEVGLEVDGERVLKVGATRVGAR